ncbi:YbbC/YhhH family protein [candidate division KSB1 bacterium]|nr:YbbC/YhhH family protein [candidate division KSB1 bacterium]
MNNYSATSIKTFLIASIIFITLSLSIFSVFLKSEDDKGIRPKDGFVPDKDTALKIAEVIWLPIYGKSIYDSKPFTAKLKNDSVWIVEGTLPDDWDGGVPYIEIQKSDCKILKVYHSK